jgi:hypothetical protein
MQIPRPTELDEDRFLSLLPTDARVEVEPMFGNLGAFVPSKKPKPAKAAKSAPKR